MNLCKSCGIDGLESYAVNGKGMGDVVCDESGCYDDGSGGTVNTSTTTSTTDSGLTSDYVTCPNGGSLGANGLCGGTVNTSTNTTQSTNAITAIANAFSSIFKTIQPLPAGCTQVAGPYGT